MADQPAPKAKPQGKGLGRKLGPLPVWAWGLIGFGAYYWYTHYGPGAQKAQAPQGGGRGGRITEIIRTQRQPRPAPAPRPAPRPKRKPGTGGVGGKTGGPPPVRQPPPRPPVKQPPPPAGPEPPQRSFPPQPVPTGQAVSAQTGQPVYAEWQAIRGPIPEPVQAYAPMTNGAVYDAGSAAASLSG